MNTPRDLADKMAAKTDHELQAMFSRPDDWTPLALDAARAEIQRRNLSPIEVAVQPTPKEWDIESVKHRRKIWLTFLFVDLAALVTFTFIFGSGAAIVAHAVCVAIFLSLYLPVAKRVLNPSDYSVTGIFIGTLLFPLFGWAYADRKIYDAIRQKASPLTSAKPQLISLAVFSLVLCLLPYAGLPMAICAVRRIGRSNGQLYGKKLAWVSVIINAAVLALMIFGITMGILSSRHAQ